MNGGTMRFQYRRVVIATVTAALVAVPGAASDAANPTAVGPPAQVSLLPTVPDVLPAATAEQVTAITAAMEARGIPSVTSSLVRTVRTTYTLPSGSVVVVESPRPTPGTVTPLFSVGAGWGIYIYLNTADQKAVYSGGAAGLAVLICGSTALLGCAAAAAALAAAAT